MSRAGAEMESGILIIDDEQAICDILQDYLSGCGYRVDSAKDASGGLALLNQNRYDLILSDYTLPDMNGKDLILAAKKKRPELQAILMSGMEPLRIMELMTDGVDDFITKPFDIKLLAHTVQRNLELVNLRRRLHSLTQDSAEPVGLTAPDDDERNRIFIEAGHQLKTPVAAVKEFIILLQEGLGGELTEKQAQYVEALDQNTRRLMYLTESLLSQGRVDSGAWRIDLEAEDPGMIIASVGNSFRPILERKGIRLVEEFEERMPTVRVDAAALEQILLNLIDNAAKFSPPNGTITLRCSIEDADFVIIRIENEGQQIPEKMVDAVFDRYVRLVEHETEPGLGLGLSIARALTRRMSGEIWVDNSFEGGVSVCLRLPVADV